MEKIALYPTPSLCSCYAPYGHNNLKFIEYINILHVNVYLQFGAELCIRDQRLRHTLDSYRRSGTVSARPGTVPVRLPAYNVWRHIQEEHSKKSKHPDDEHHGLHPYFLPSFLPPSSGLPETLVLGKYLQTKHPMKKTGVKNGVKELSSRKENVFYGSTLWLEGSFSKPILYHKMTVKVFAIW